MKRNIVILLAGLLVCLPAIGAKRHNVDYDIFSYGATHDTTKVQTTAINAAIQACSLAGGGRVVVPAGKYITGTLVLKDNVELHLAQGAYLIASGDDKDFPAQPSASYRSEKDSDGWLALIYAVEAKNISITGRGVIDGRGRGRGRRGQTTRTLRPKNVVFVSCSNVRVEGITMRNAATWNQHYVDCEDVTIDDIKVFNHCNGNNDGLDIDGCRRFVITGSIIDSDDDAIVLKSTGSAPCEDIIISNCIMSSFANAVKCGIESIGGFRNILISDCIVKPSSNHGERFLKTTPSGITAISLEIVDGGVMDGVSIDNILIQGTECPLYVRLGNRGRRYPADAPAPPVGQMRNISISNITAYGTGNFCASITGIPQAKIENIYLSNIKFMNRGGLMEGHYMPDPQSDGKRHDMSRDNRWDRYWASHKELVEDEKGYPQPTVWGNLPSYGLFMRHVGVVSLEGMTFNPQGTEPRVPVIAVDVDYLQIRGMSVVGDFSRDILLDGVCDYIVDDSQRMNILHADER
ncbi:MAG: glycoside hydrolase family 28 protein [Candidatus Cryptobacteroides sp.]